MTYLLDASTCIRYLNGRSESIRRRVESTDAGELALCSIVKAELLYGAFKSARPDSNLARLARFFEGFVSFPCDDAAAEVYGEVRARLERRGLPIGPNDLFIAAIANDATLVTHNVDEFSRLERLRWEDWE